MHASTPTHDGSVAPTAPLASTAPAEPAMGTRVLRNTMINAIASLSSALVTAIMTPFLIGRLGPASYGVWLLALGVSFSSGYVALADLGLADAAVKLIAEARAIGRRDRVDAVASTTLAAFLVIGFVASTALVLLVPALLDLFDIDGAAARDARLAFTLMALEVLIELPIAALRAVVEGAQHYKKLRALDLGGRLAWAAAAIVAVRQGHGVVALAALSLAVAVVRAIVALALAHRTQPGLRLRPANVGRSTLRELLGFGSMIGGLRLLSVVYGQMDRIIIGTALGVTAVATYEVSYRIFMLATIALTITSSAVVPAAAFTAARRHTDTLRNLYLNGTKLGMAFALPVTIGAIIYTGPLIETWVGAEYRGAMGATRLFLLFPVLTSANQVGTAMATVLGRVRQILVLQTVAVTTNLVVSVLLAPRYGITGVIAGTCIGGTVVWYPYVRLLHGTFEVASGEWFRRTILPNVPGALAQVAFGAITLAALPHVDALWQALGLYGLSCAVSMAAFALVGLDRAERRRLVGTVLPHATHR